MSPDTHRQRNARGDREPDGPGRAYSCCVRQWIHALRGAHVPTKVGTYQSKGPYNGFGENVRVAITPRSPPGRTLTCQPYRSHRRLTIDRPMPPPCEWPAWVPR